MKLVRGMSLEQIGRDLRYALRSLRRTPGFTATAVLSLALGIGANTLVFSALNALVLRPLPVERPADLFFLESARGPSHSFPLYRDIRDRGGAAAEVAGYRIAPMNLAGGQAVARIWGYLATGNYFDLLGVQPAAGRFFHQDDDRQAGASPYVVLSYDCWQSRFSGDADISGRVVTINGRPYTVLGVAPAGFYGTERFYRPEVWVPMMMQAQIEAGNPWLERRQTGNVWILVRLASGTSAEQAQSRLNLIAADLVREYPDYYRNLRFVLTRPGFIGSMLGAPVRAFAVGVQLLGGLVLLAACLNLAMVLLARGADRQRELAIRLSIGASRARIVRQLLTESLLLSAAGGVAGGVIAVGGAHLASAWRAPVDFPVLLDVRPDWSVLVFAVVVSTLCGVVFGLAPARQAARTDPNVALKGTPPLRIASRRRWAIRDVLVGVQVALCCMLVSACFLGLVGLNRALTMPLGFEPRGVVLAGADLALAGYDQAGGARFQREALDAVRRLPGVQAAAYSNSVPLSIDQSTTTIRPTDQPITPSSETVTAIYYQVSPGFFETLGIRLLAGRDFDWRDGQTAPRVAVVNRAFARAVMQTAEPVGRRFPYGRDVSVEVIGLVEDGKYQSLAEVSRPAIFWSILQSYNPTTTLTVRSDLPVDGSVRAVRAAVAGLDPTLPLHSVGSLNEMLRFARFPSRAAAAMLGLFGLLAVTLAAIGLHGVVSYAVSRRGREIGIRVAIGARPSAVLRLVVARTAIVLASGAGAGLLLSFLAGDLLAAIVSGASVQEPAVVAAVSGSMIAIGIAACWAPVRRALRTSVTNALRPE